MARAQGEGHDRGWSEAEWARFDDETRRRALAAGSEADAWRVVVRASRAVMRKYTTSFFIVSRFLPRAKRDQVEAIYAAVRYPDEVVDTFPLPPDRRMEILDRWGRDYERGLGIPTLCAGLDAGVPAFLAGFHEVVRRAAIPPEHYRAFLDAMRRVVRPRPFATLDALVNDYIHGSAVVVGYFLAHVYGPSAPGRFADALACSRDLGIALQLTNFLRDVTEDARRGRLYLPLDLLREEGLEAPDPADPAHGEAIGRVVRRLAEHAAGLYHRAQGKLDAFAADSRVAIRACIDVYGLLNDRILRSPGGIARRESVPMREKLRALPAGKYWRIPLAYLLR